MLIASSQSALGTWKPFRNTETPPWAGQFSEVALSTFSHMPILWCDWAKIPMNVIFQR